MQTDPEIEAKIERIGAMRIIELRALYRQTFRSDPPKAFGPDLLRRSIAYCIQEKAYGGLDRATSRLLRDLVAQYAKSPGKLTLPRRDQARCRAGAQMEGRASSGHGDGARLFL